MVMVHLIFTVKLKTKIYTGRYMASLGFMVPPKILGPPLISKLQVPP